MRPAFQPERGWLFRRPASIHADAAIHVRTLAFCSRNLSRQFFLFLFPQGQSKKTSSDPVLGPLFLRIEPRAVAEVPLPQPQEKRDRENPTHRRTHTPPAVPWLVQAAKTSGSAVRSKQDCTNHRCT